MAFGHAIVKTNVQGAQLCTKRMAQYAAQRRHSMAQHSAERRVA